MTSAAAAPPAPSVCAEGCERLRRQALEPGSWSERMGLAVFARRGTAAWLLECCAAPPQDPAPPAAGAAAPALPDAAWPALVDALQSMIMSRMEGEVP